MAWLTEEWPAQDRAAWELARKPRGFLQEGGKAASWRPASIKAAVGEYGRWLAFLHDGDLLDANEPPDARVNPAALGAYIALLEDNCKPVTVASYIATLGMMVQAMVPAADWAWYWRVHTRLKRRAVPSRNKRARIVPAQDLLQLGHDLMSEAEASGPEPTLASALAFREGLMIATLILLPLRHKNFVALEIGGDLIRSGVGYALRLLAEQTKTHRPLNADFPPQLVSALTRYLDHYRPFLVSQVLTRGRSRLAGRSAGARLWVNQYGQALSENTPIGPLVRRTTDHFGHNVTTHLFRDCAVTTIADEAPEMVRMGASVLGHASYATTERHYIAANQQIAMGRYNEQVNAMRVAVRPKARRRPIA